MTSKKEKPNSEKQEPSSKNRTANIKELVMRHKLSITKRREHKAHIVKQQQTMNVSSEKSNWRGCIVRNAIQAWASG